LAATGARRRGRPDGIRAERLESVPRRTTGAVSSVGRAPARQAGGHWFEPSTAHTRKARKRGPFVFTEKTPRESCPQNARSRRRNRLSAVPGGATARKYDADAEQPTP